MINSASVSKDGSKGCARDDAAVIAVAARAAALGEPWLSRFHPADLSAMLRGKIFAPLEDLELRIE